MGYTNDGKAMWWHYKEYTFNAGRPLDPTYWAFYGSGVMVIDPAATTPTVFAGWYKIFEEGGVRIPDRGWQRMDLTRP
jgi:hypothetical protein